MGRLTCGPEPPVNRAGTAGLYLGLWHTPTCTGPRAPVTRSLCALTGSVVADTWGSWGGDLWLARLGSWPSPGGWLVCRKGRMVSQPSGPLRHRPLPTTWLPVPVRVGAGKLELCYASLLPSPPQPSHGLPVSLPGVCVCVLGVCVSGAGRSRRVLGMCDLGRTFSCT